MFLLKNLTWNATMAKAAVKIPIPRSMQVQLGRLFGTNSKEARGEARTAAQCRRTLQSVLCEIDGYVQCNVDTDDLHLSMMRSALDAAYESLKEDDFWLGYIEGITRLALVLLGDYPDHRRRKPGRKKDNHYNLNGLRSACWVQTPNQRFRTILAVGRTGFPKLSVNPRDVLDEFRRQFGYRIGYPEFIEWYRVNYPQDYIRVFR
jgi:hypothetical protein